MAAAEAKLRVFFIPFFATGHIIPMFELARLIARRHGVESTMLLTPANAALIPFSGHPVRLLLYSFPSADVGLPAGQENIASVPSSDTWKVDKAVGITRATLDPIIRHHRPDAIVADFHFWWALITASDLNIPGLTFAAIGVFAQMVINSLDRHRTHERARAEDEPFTVPGLPGPPIEIVRSEIPLLLRSRDREAFAENLDKVKAVESLRYGMVVNTFYEMEGTYCDQFRVAERRRSWFVGPVALADADGDAVAESGDRCLSWLETQKPRSVVFVCFGSWCHFTAKQLRELAVGLEASGHPFLWAVREKKAEEWMPEGWEERVGERGLVVMEWAPQVVILNHAAVGAFMTHCGWNSVLEAVAAGVPMLTWPLVFDHFIIERLVVGVLGTGARVWHRSRGVDEAEKVVVPAAAIGRAVAEFMEAGGPGEEARRRALEYAAMAKTAVAEGGSSYRDLNGMIDELMATTGRKGVDELR